MPPLSTHIRLATFLMPSLGIVAHVESFLMGSTAPDAFEADNEESFSQHHFKDKDGRISLESFLKDTHFTSKPADNPSWAFTCGYYSHLWLDAFCRNNPDRLPVKRPAGVSETDLRILLRRDTEILNAPFVLHVGNVPISCSEDVMLPLGLEFVNLERCIHLFHEVLKQSQAWSQLVPSFESLDEAEYTAFLGEAAKVFRNELDHAP